MSVDQTLPELTGLVLWLIPSEPFAIFYRKEIERLSVRYKTTRFEPHLTLGRFADNTVEQQNLQLPKSLTSTIKGHISATNVHPECSTSPYQNLVHVLNPGDDLAQIQIDLKSQLPEYQPKEEYHISLMYGDIPCRVLESEIFDLSKRLPQKVIFSKIRAIQLNGQPDSWRSLWEQEF